MKVGDKVKTVSISKFQLTEKEKTELELYVAERKAVRDALPEKTRAGAFALIQKIWMGLQEKDKEELED